MSAPVPTPEPGARPSEDRAAINRARILEGLAIALAEKGYAATTVADIAAAAHMSRTTVYEQFAEKDRALIALYADLGDRLLELLAREFSEQDPELPWPDRVQRIMGVYLGAMAAASAGERLSLLEIASAGPRAREARRDVLDRFSEAIRWMSDVFADGTPEVRALGSELSLAVVGAINELVLRAAEDGSDAVRDLRGVTSELIVRLMAVPPTDGATDQQSR